LCPPTADAPPFGVPIRPLRAAGLANQVAFLAKMLFTNRLSGCLSEGEQVQESG